MALARFAFQACSFDHSFKPLGHLFVRTVAPNWRPPPGAERSLHVFPQCGCSSNIPAEAQDRRY